MSRWFSRSLSLTALGAAVGVLVALAPGAAQAAPYCGQVWGSLPESGGVAMSRAAVTDVRVGRHECFDRMVVDLDGDVAGWTVRYVPVVVQDGSGAPVALRGAGDIEVVVRAPAYDEDGPTWVVPVRTEAADVRGFTTFRQVAQAGSYEGVTTIGLGVRARLPFRVLVLDGPGDGSRLVVDVGHRW